jgi:hypothetical protein
MGHENGQSVKVDFDVAGVIAEAVAYADAIVAGDVRLAETFLAKEPKAGISPVLAALPESITGAEVVSLTLPDSGRSTTLTRYSGEGDPVLVLAIWVETTAGLMIREQRIAGVAT